MRSRIALTLAVMCGCAAPPIPDPDTSAMESQVAEKIARTRALVEDSPRTAETWGELGMVFHAHELFSEAAASYAQARALDPEDYRWPYLEAQCLKEIRELDGALEAVSAAIQSNGRYPPLFVLRAELHESNGNDDEALAAFRAALEVDDRTAPAAYGVGRLLFAKGELAESRELLEKAARLAPEAGAIHATLARLYRRLGDRERALRSAGLARELHPEVPMDDPLMVAVSEEAVSVVGLQSRAVEAEARGDSARAEALLRRMISLRPEEANLYYNLANNLARQGRFEEAETQYREALSRRPDHVFALINLGNALSQRGDLDGAGALYERALELEPGNPSAHSSLGKLAATRGDIGTATLHVERALELDPRDAEMHYVLAQLRRHQGRGADALASFERATELAPHRPDILFDFAVTHAQQGNYASAWKWIHEAERLGWTTPPDFRAALHSQMPDPAAR